MLKKFSFPLLVLLAALILIPAPQASAAVRFGVFVGGPVYTYPVYPRPYVYPYAYAPYPAYGYAAPAYGYWGGYRGDHRRHEWREHERREHRERYRGYRGDRDYRR
jgi:hypothetical protein